MTPAAASTPSAKIPSNVPQDVQDPVLAALFDFKDSVNKVDTRVAVLEKSTFLGNPSLLSIESTGVFQNDLPPW